MAALTFVSRRHPAVVRSLVSIALSVGLCTSVQAQTTADEIQLRATVKAVGLLADFPGKAIPVGFDPRFALTVRIESAVPATTDFKLGSVVTFAIHSPALLFAGEPKKGKTYEFSLRRKIEDGKSRFFDLRVGR